MPESPVYAVIMAGGSGTRFWPLSRAAQPKQLVRILGDDTMIQATVARLQPFIPAERVLIVTTAALAEETRRQLPGIPPHQIIAEPVGRDTAACVALAALAVRRLDPNATMVLLPADQVIRPADAFQRALAAGVQVAQSGALVTYGIEPRHPATGYGYIKLATQQPEANGCKVHRALRFVEKPDEATAKQYLAEGGYRWNAGIFTWRADAVLDQLAQHCGWLVAALEGVGAAFGTPRFDTALADAYRDLKRISIDYALMERAANITVVTGAFTWDDLGAWDALYDHLPLDPRGVGVRGDAIAIDCKDSLLVGEGGLLVAGIGLDRITVVATRDAVLVVPRGKSQLVKQVIEAVKARGRGDLL
jgi:mannose-1-phosphate guanylyltransferase